MVTLLLDYGADVDHVPSHDNRDLDWLKPRSTALHEACGVCSRAVIRVLVLRGADVERRDWMGRSVLERAVEMGSDGRDVVGFLRDGLVRKIARRCDW